MNRKMLQKKAEAYAEAKRIKRANDVLSAVIPKDWDGYFEAKHDARSFNRDVADYLRRYGVRR